MPNRGRQRGDQGPLTGPSEGLSRRSREGSQRLHTHAQAHTCIRTRMYAHAHARACTIPARASTRQHRRAQASSCVRLPCTPWAAKRWPVPQVVAGATPKGGSGAAQSPCAAVSTDPAALGMGVRGGSSRGRAVSPRPAPSCPRDGAGGSGDCARGLRGGREASCRPRCERARAPRPSRERSFKKTPLCQKSKESLSEINGWEI